MESRRRIEANADFIIVSFSSSFVNIIRHRQQYGCRCRCRVATNDAITDASRRSSGIDNNIIIVVDVERWQRESIGVVPSRSVADDVVLFVDVLASLWLQCVALLSLNRFLTSFVRSDESGIMARFTRPLAKHVRLLSMLFCAFFDDRTFSLSQGVSIFKVTTVSNDYSLVRQSDIENAGATNVRRQQTMRRLLMRWLCQWRHFG